MERATWARRVILFVAAAAAAAALIGGIISSRATAASPSPSPASGKVTLKIGVMEPVDSLNPFIGWADISYELFYLQYLKLAGRDVETAQPQPGAGIAKSWEVSPDGLTWTFYLNEDLSWSDGEPVTAEDVAFTINYIIDNEMSMFTTATQYIEKAVVVDPYTVKIICTQPKANLLGVTWFVLPKHIWSKISPEDAANKFENPPPIIGDGPFQVVEWKRNDYVALVANKDFRCGPIGPAKIDELLFVQYQNADTMVQDLKAGNLDAAYGVPPAQYESLENTPGIGVAKYTWVNWEYLAFNCYTGKSRGNPVLRDQRFRSALEYAVDRERIVDVACNGYAIPGYTFLPPGSYKDPDYSWQPPDGVRRDFDLAKASQLLDEAGYKMGPDGIRLDKQGKPIVLRLWSTNAVPETQSAAKLIAGWFREVGVGTKLSAVDEGVYYDAIWNYEGDTFVPDFDMYLGLRLRRTRPELQLLHDRADREQQRVRLVEQGVRPPRRGAECHARPRQAGRGRQATATGDVRGLPLHRVRPPLQAGGLPHRQVDGLAARQVRYGSRFPRPVDPLPLPESGAQDRGREWGRPKLDLDRRHRRHRDRRCGGRDTPGAPRQAPPGRGGVGGPESGDSGVVDVLEQAGVARSSA